jgi:predicted anti-sigma-YlaC factor YlaD
MNKAGLVIVAFLLPCFLAFAPTAFPEEICFSQGDAGKVLVELERCRNLEEGLAKCSAAMDISREAAEACESLRAEVQERIAVLTKERDEAIKAADEAVSAGKKASRDPWYVKAWTAGKWAIAGGAAVAIGTAVLGGR